MKILFKHLPKHLKILSFNHWRVIIVHKLKLLKTTFKQSYNLNMGRIRKKE